MLRIKELDMIRKQCRTMVNKRATASAMAAVVPVPGVDIGADVAIMLELLPAINRKFGLSPEQLDQVDGKMKAQILVIATSLGSEVIGKVITKEVITTLLKKVGIKVASKQVAKFIPILGQAAAAGISFGAMKHLGNSHIEDCYQVCRKIADNKMLSDVTN